MKKVFAALGIAFVSIVFMSHNVDAYDLNNLVGAPSQTGEFSMTCNNGGNCNSSNNSGIINNFNIKLYNEYSQARALTVGRYVQLNFYGYKLTDNASNHSVIASLGTPAGGNTGLNILDVKFEMMTTNTYKWTVVAYVSTSRNTYDFDFGNGSLVFRNQEYINSGTWAEFQPKDITVNVDTQSIVNAVNNSASQSQQMQQLEEQAINDAVDNSQDAGQDSSDAATAGTGSLISAIGSAVAAITSASPTNCLMNGNMGNLNVGQIDLCANPVPTFVSIIGSLLLVLFIVPLCISLFNRFINLFRSFQS